jgi:hypothetical protein
VFSLVFPNLISKEHKKTRIYYAHSIGTGCNCFMVLPVSQNIIIIQLFIYLRAELNNNIFFQFNTYLFTCKLNSPEANYRVSTSKK